MKKILKFLLGAKPSLDVRENNPCELVVGGKYCPFTNCYMKCSECPHFEGEKDV